MTHFEPEGRWTLDGHVASAREARARVREAAAGHSALDDVELVVTELVVNAAEHGDGPIDIALDRAPGLMRLVVSSSAGTVEPTVQPPSVEAGGGRGLALVEALADRWGWDRVGDRIAVWAEFADEEDT